MNKSRKTIAYGDRIYARVTKNGRTILDFMTEQVSNMTELIGELRRAMKNIQGIVILHIRNYHQGWGAERPLMLYAPRIPDYAATFVIKESTVSVSEPSRMLRPWEVH